MPVEALPPVTFVGVRLSDDTVIVGGSTVSVAVLVSEPSVAETVTFVDEATADVETLKFADVIPEDTVTVAGTEAAGLSLETETAVPPTAAEQAKGGLHPRANRL